MYLRQYFRDHPPRRIAWRGFGLGLIALINRWMGTLNYRMARYAKDTDPANCHANGPAIFVFWHEYIPVPLYLRPHCRMAVLLSMHQDAELLTQAAHFAGLETVRGSTHRGGATALMAMLNRGKAKSLAITPDGPRGPRRILAPGCIYLSSRIQIPIIPIGVGYDKPWRYRRVWDQFAIPRPFSRARVVCGPRIQVPADLAREKIEEFRLRIEVVLNQITESAEQWASGEIQLKCEEQLFRTPGRFSNPGT